MAMILSAGLMLRHLGFDDQAQRLEGAVAKVLANGETRPADLRPTGAPATTQQVADAICEAL